jgi:Fe-S-cluster-containing dehydrogenase component/anaerobic selenocysteine-containing dehydrogenase
MACRIQSSQAADLKTARPVTIDVIGHINDTTPGTIMSDRTQKTSSTKQWLSLGQLAGTVEPAGEFQPGVTEPAQYSGGVSRRGFMALLSTSMALTAASCRRPIQKLIPAVKSNQTLTPGLPIDYTTVWTTGNVAYGAVVRCREGRPIKVKGNEQHPVNRGKASAAMQASILSLYDSDRIRRPRVGKGQSSYDNAVQKIADAITEAAAQSKRVVLAVDEHPSPSFAALLADFVQAVPSATVVIVPAVVCDNAVVANQAVLGVSAELVADLSLADVIVSVEADFLGTDPLAVYHTSRFASRRLPTASGSGMNTLIVAEAQYTLTGSNADERFRVHPSQFDSYLACIEQALSAGSVGADLTSAADEATRKASQSAAAALKRGGSRAVVMVGKHLSPRAHAIGLSINAALGSLGDGIVNPARVLPMSGARAAGVQALESDMASGNVHAFIAINVNPEYSASQSFKAALAKVPFRAALNLYEDETAAISHVSIPAAHYLETWGDAIAIDGSLSLRQPMIAPLNEGVPGIEDTLMLLARKVSPGAYGEENESYYNYVRARWMPRIGGTEKDWANVLRKGLVEGQPLSTSFAIVGNGSALAASSAPSGNVVVAVPDLGIGTGADTNNGWLMEMPDPVTKITWDNVALMSPATAVSMGLCASVEAKDAVKANEQVITISTERGAIDLPVWVQVGMADGVVATQLGFGRSKAGSVGTGVGSNAYQITSPTHSFAYQAVASATAISGKRHRIAATQDHHTLDDGNGERQIAHSVTTGDLAAGKLKEHDLNAHYYSKQKDRDGRFAVPLSITPDYQYKGHRWGMVIDMSACTGCSSCVVACQSENNIPVVGKDQVLRGREMQWIRIDRYYTGDMSNPDTVVEPMLCQHCENAPCENVCPVAATTHSPEGLNEMTYNRCVGTRYCLNNCPYKVRRFNFLNYNIGQTSPLDLVFNPEVTKRDRGVMEKCTFCVQRINDAKYHAKDAGRARVLDGEVVTACQEACPAGAIIFGDMNDPQSSVSKARNNERGFHVLAELNVRPSVTYLANVRNRPATVKTDGGHH